MKYFKCDIFEFSDFDGINDGYYNVNMNMFSNINSENNLDFNNNDLLESKIEIEYYN